MIKFITFQPLHKGVFLFLLLTAKKYFIYENFSLPLSQVPFDNLALSFIKNAQAYRMTDSSNVT